MTGLRTNDSNAIAATHNIKLNSQIEARPEALDQRTFGEHVLQRGMWRTCPRAPQQLAALLSGCFPLKACLCVLSPAGTLASLVAVGEVWAPQAMERRRR